MNILFLSLADYSSLNEHNIYTDLLSELVNRGNTVYAVSPVERRTGQKTHIIYEGSAKILKLRIGNTQKTNPVEKGLSTLLIEPQFVYGIKKYFSDVRFDLILYATPPITFCKAIHYVKKRDKAYTYLLLKDIFPQNALDLGMLKESGFRGVLYRRFRQKERKLYAISDKIGCMSQANVEYIIKHNPDISAQKIEVFPNCIDPIDKSVDTKTKESIRNKYGLPLDRTVFVYGGNLGKPQGIPFLIKCLKSQVTNSKVFFLIVGDGTEYPLLEAYVNSTNAGNLALFRRISKNDYDTLVAACDVGMVFLDNRFTIPNFPSRLLNYLQVKIPVLAVTDCNTDIGKIVETNGFGWATSSDELSGFEEKMQTIQNESAELFSVRGESGYSYLKENYSVKSQADKIFRAIESI